MWLFDLSTLDGMLLGSVLAATDGAAIFALLRGSTLKRRLATTLEGESGFNDPVAILLVLGFIEWLQRDDYGIADMAVLFVRQLGIGLAIGVVVGVAAAWALRRVTLATAGLYPVATLAVAALAFGGADALHGSGFLAVYLAGLALGTAGIPAQQTVTSFHQGLAWVAQVSMFVALGLLVFPSHLDDVACARDGARARARLRLAPRRGRGVDAADALHLGRARSSSRPPACAAPCPSCWRPSRSSPGVSGSTRLFDVVFFAVLLSTVIQGIDFEPLARVLGATTDEPALPRPLAEAGTIRRLGAEVLEYPVADDDAVVGARVRDLGLPREAVVNVIVRGGEAIPPRGSTILRAGDRLHVLLRSELSRDVHTIVERWRKGPIGPPPRPPRRMEGRPPTFTVAPLGQLPLDGDAAHPRAVAGAEVVAQLRVRRDVPGCLVALEDGRYAMVGPLVAVGSAPAAVELGDAPAAPPAADDSERAWLQNVVGALAADLQE